MSETGEREHGELGDLAAVVRGVAVWLDEDGSPPATLLGPTLRRRASRLSRMAAHVLGELAERHAIDLAAVAVVIATAYGEMETTDALLTMMHEGEGLLSPARFATSVHNTAGGLISIATGARGLSTTVSAGDETVPMGLLEAMTLLGEGTAPVALVVADEGLPPTLREAPGGGLYGGLAAALLLDRAGEGPRLRRLRRAVEAPALPPLPASVAANPCAPVLALTRGLDAGPGCIPLARGDGLRWCVDCVSDDPAPRSAC